MGRLRVHLGEMVNNRHVGLRPGSEVAVAIDGNQCEAEGMRFFKAANGVILDEGFGGLIPKTYISKVYQLRDGKILYTRPGGRIGGNWKGRGGEETAAKCRVIDIHPSKSEEE